MNTFTKRELNTKFLTQIWTKLSKILKILWTRAPEKEASSDVSDLETDLSLADMFTFVLSIILLFPKE